MVNQRNLDPGTLIIGTTGEIETLEIKIDKPTTAIIMTLMSLKEVDILHQRPGVKAV